MKILIHRSVYGLVDEFFYVIENYFVMFLLHKKRSARMRPDAWGICLLKQTASGAQSETSPSKIDGFRGFEVDLSALACKWIAEKGGISNELQKECEKQIRRWTPTIQSCCWEGCRDRSGASRPFENHPFKVKEDEVMARLMESIERYGIMNPLIVMPTTEGFYRIISGHRRKYCAERLGYTQVPVIIRYMKEDDLIISMVSK